jgi:hypothetical protein
MSVIYKEELGSPVAAVSASKDGHLVAALTDSNGLAVYSPAPKGGVRLVGSADVRKLVPGPACQECDLAFHPINNGIVIIGERTRTEGKFVHPSLAILLLSQNGQALDRHFLVEADPPYSSPVVTDTDPPVLLVGTAGGVLCIDLESGQECGRLENVDEYVAPRGIVPRYRGGAQVFVVWTYQAGSRISSYRRLDDNSFTDIHEADQLLPFFAWGAALSQDDSRLAVTLGNISAPVVEAGKSAGPVPLGQVHLYEPDSHRLLSVFEVSGQVGRDAILQRVDSLRSTPSGDAWVPASSPVPKRHLTNPVFVGNNRVAYGTPGGSVRVLDTHDGRYSEAEVTGSAITSLAACAEPGLLCVGCANGSLYFLAIER